ncbi:hypothetical protein CFAL_05030 [Corynebacterium falsenii DSM 44353]|uniref:DUF4194 domain-containing protein n=1 Tax=Corynebacterium falsenii TaxID=108486 RepID=UPI0003E96517|nr:DUF4194 domain-containing protein [Corynebacterium falsenii]AHI03043.1 hypothetical protein CFAL_05030 [Corynebacterium falsenii DSM 44353]UBI03754.1 DUF4194 domain-containing protein [Corynebacterium falsenii]UBI06237.1 DUF4194 domain-containing protein [Corynebacterium falsenii]
MSESNSPEQQIFEGDTGTLSLDSRRALARLLKGPLLTAQGEPHLWNAVVTDTAAITSALHNVFLDLVLDETDQIAFTRMVEPAEGVTIPRVLRTETLKHIDTLILLQLRQELALNNPGERVIVDADELRQQIWSMRNPDNRDEAGFNKRFDAAMKRISDTFSLLKKTETPQRYEISRALRHVFDVKTTTSIIEEYRRLAEQGRGVDL